MNLDSVKFPDFKFARKRLQIYSIPHISFHVVQIVCVVLIVLVLCLQIDALLRSYQQGHGDKIELLQSAMKTADLGILLGAPLCNADCSMTRVASLLSHALTVISSGETILHC